MVARFEKVLLALVLLIGGCGFLHADLNANATPKLKKKKEIPATVSQPSALPDVVNTEVDRGGEATIRLRGIARSGGKVEFKLLRKPSHGKILKTTPVGLDTMELIYRHSGSQDDREDSLIFAVRAGGSGPFSPAAAKILVKNLPGRLQAPELLEFSTTLAGKTSTETFLLVNQGGTPLNGKIEVIGPWQIEGPAEYDLIPGGRKKIVVTFSPTQDGPLQGKIRFNGSAPADVELRGQGSAPFLASSKSINLNETSAGNRTGTIALQNNTSGELTVAVQSDVASPKEVILKFGETRDLTFEDQGIGAIRSFVTLSTAGFQQRIEINAVERTIAEATPAANPLIAQVEVPKSAASPGSMTPPTNTPNETPTAQPSPLEPPLPKKSTVNFPVRIIPLSKDRVRLEWSLPKNSRNASYVVEERYLSWDKEHEIKMDWLPVPNAKIAMSGNQGIATIENLRAATAFTFRISETGISEKAGGQISLPVTYQTPPGMMKRFDWRWPLLLAGGVLLLMTLKKRWQERAVSW